MHKISQNQSHTFILYGTHFSLEIYDSEEREYKF